MTVINAATAISPTRLPPGSAFDFVLNWGNVTTLPRNDAVFVHFVNAANGATVNNFQDDHDPTVPTSQWSGNISYKRTALIPSNAPNGTYNIIVGLYYQSGSQFINEPLTPGSGVTKGSGNEYIVGQVVVDSAAARPLTADQRTKTLNLTGWVKTFEDTFDTLTVGRDNQNPSSTIKWFAGTGAAFADNVNAYPGAANDPYSVANGQLSIKATKNSSGQWVSGLMASVNSGGAGFKQKYGYFEIRSKFPPGPGTFPALWLETIGAMTNFTQPFVEIDIVEQWANPTQKEIMYSTVHQWQSQGGAEVFYSCGSHIPSMGSAFHDYGCMVTPTDIIFYIDQVELWRMPTPTLAKEPIFMLIDLAIGGLNNPFTNTPNPSIMLVDRVSVWQNPAWDSSLPPPPPPPGNLLSSPDLSTSGWIWNRTGRGEGVGPDWFQADATDRAGGVVRYETANVATTGSFTLAIELKPVLLQYASIGIAAPNGTMKNSWASLLGDRLVGDYDGSLAATVSVAPATADGYIRLTVTGAASQAGGWTVWFGVPDGQSGNTWYRNASFTVQ